MKRQPLHALLLVVLLWTAAFLTSCASPPRAAIDPGADLKTEIDRIEAQLQTASHNQYDRLAPESYERAKVYRGLAKEKLEEGRPAEEIRDDLAVAKHAIERVERIGSTHAPALRSVLEARRNAINTQAPKFQEKEFAAADAELEKISDDLEKEEFEIDAEELTELQEKYIKVETEARKIVMLKNTREMIEQAEDEGADKRTPETLATAEAQLAAAERAIEISLRSPAGYTPAVESAHSAALKLKQVHDIAKTHNASEQAALSLWAQNAQIEANNAALAKSNTEAAAREAELARHESELAAQQAAVAALEEENERYASDEELKRKIEELRQAFDPEEAEVLKDGNRLVVRLKQMQFNSGRSELRPESYETLKKVEDLIAAVPAEQVTVEGHTDSTGSVETNRKLSEQRAENVKKYLENQDLPDDIRLNATGYGADRPLTTNKTKKGRAVNRRVDIVIETPAVL